MVNHVINKEAFEVTCTSESVAKTVQEEIEHHTGSQINSIISSILTERATKEGNLKIEKIEIDLGDISLNDFGKGFMLDKFKRIFAEKIDSLYNTVESADIREGRSFGFLESEWEMIRAFILHGDVPWWVDKKSATDPDAILRKLIRRSPQMVRLFLEEQKHLPDVLLRLSGQYKPATRSMINALVPGVIPSSPGKSLFDKFTAYLDSLSYEQLAMLMSVVLRNTSSSADARVRLL